MGMSRPVRIETGPEQAGTESFTQRKVEQRCRIAHTDDSDAVRMPVFGIRSQDPIGLTVAGIRRKRRHSRRTVDQKRTIRSAESGIVRSTGGIGTGDTAGVAVAHSRRDENGPKSGGAAGATAAAGASAGTGCLRRALVLRL